MRDNSSSSGGSLPHSLRQLLLQLSSVHGHIFEDEDQRRAYASFLVEGTAAVLSSPLVAGAPSDGVNSIQIVLQHSTIVQLLKSPHIV